MYTIVKFMYVYKKKRISHIVMKLGRVQVICTFRLVLSSHPRIIILFWNEQKRSFKAKKMP